MKTLNLKTLSNERGGMAALLSVIVLSMIMVSTLSSFYIYLENRAKFQERLRMNYQTGYVMEDLGRAMALARGQYNVVTGTCPAGTAVRFLDCSEVCATPTAALTNVPAGAPSHAICVKSDTLNKIVNNADYFCAYNADGGTAKPASCTDGSIADNVAPINDDGATIAFSKNNNKSKINNWYSRLDNFFDTTIVKNAPVLANKMYPVLESRLQPPTVLGWLLPQTAYAGTGGGLGGGILGGGTPTPDMCERYPTLPGCAAVTPPPTTPPVVVQPPAPPTPGDTVTLESCQTNPKPACKSFCTINAAQGFCKVIDATITVTQIGGGTYQGASNCSNTPGTPVTDARCKRCGASERNAGSCLKISVCPPWLNSTACSNGAANGDQRLHQMISIN